MHHASIHFATVFRLIAIALLVTALSFSTAGAVDADGNKLVGIWLTEGGESKVEISEQDGIYSGKLVWLKEPDRDGKPLHDAHNDDPKLRDRPLMGTAILSGFRYQDGGKWTGGEVYSPQRGKSYPAEISLSSADQLDLEVKAGFITKQEVWTR